MRSYRISFYRQIDKPPAIDHGFDLAILHSEKAGHCLSIGAEVARHICLKTVCYCQAVGYPILGVGLSFFHTN